MAIFLAYFNEYVNVASLTLLNETFSEIFKHRAWHLVNEFPWRKPIFCESQGRTTELSSDGIYYCLELPGKMEERRSSRENKMQITQTKVTFSFGKNNTEMREGPLITKEKWGNNGNFDCKRKEINLKLPIKVTFWYL